MADVQLKQQPQSGAALTPTYCKQKTIKEKSIAIDTLCILGIMDKCDRTTTYLLNSAR